MDSHCDESMQIQKLILHDCLTHGSHGMYIRVGCGECWQVIWYVAWSIRISSILEGRRLQSYLIYGKWRYRVDVRIFWLILCILEEICALHVEVLESIHLQPNCIK